MRIAVPTEIFAGESRVATTPEAVGHLKKLGFDVALQAGAGVAASYSDRAYAEAGASIVASARELYAAADIILKVRAPQKHAEQGYDEVELLKPGQVLISFLWPAQNPNLLQRLAARGVTALAMDSIPRISRAQKLDALSSMANIAGYRAIVEAAQHFGRFFRGQVTAAGKIPPAKVLSSARVSPVSQRSARRKEWARSCAHSTRAPRSRSRSRAWTRSSSCSTSPKTGAAPAVTRRS
jgi:NAD(P) transhydrogenase subunit alpha